mmetsp:Transcript_3202/g.4889  ORF Transcript_3202/g.4889 Transcript_3202/m.4889 type:complete len:196 (+) Transcript_3202:65-652(+)
MQLCLMADGCVEDMMKGHHLLGSGNPQDVGANKGSACSGSVDAVSNAGSLNGCDGAQRADVQAKRRTEKANTDAKRRDRGYSRAGEKCHFCTLYGSVRSPHGARAPNLIVTPCQVKLHRDENDCWIVSDGIVFDVSIYMDEHPGGKRSLLRRGGGAMDCLEDFNFHSRRGKQVWERFKIGKLAPCDAAQNECVIL